MIEIYINNHFSHIPVFKVWKLGKARFINKTKLEIAIHFNQFSENLFCFKLLKKLKREYCIPFFSQSHFRGFRGWTSLRENNMTAKSRNTLV